MLLLFKPSTTHYSELLLHLL